MLSKELINSHPLKTAEIKFTPPDIAQQLEGWRRLSKGHPSENLTMYHRGLIHLHNAHSFIAVHDQTWHEERTISSKHLQMIIEFHLKSANDCMTKIIHLKKLGVTSEECVPFNDIIDAVKDVSSWLFARNIFLGSVDDDIMGFSDGLAAFGKGIRHLNDGSISDYNQHLDGSESPYVKTKRLGAQGDDNGSDDGRDTTVRPVNDTVDSDDLIGEKYGETIELSAKHNGEIEDYEENGYNEVAVMAGQNLGKEVYLTNVECNDKSFTMAEAKIIHGFLCFMKRDRLGLSSMMNVYLDRMDATPDFNDVDMEKLTKGLMAMEMGGIVDDTNEDMSSPPSAEAQSSTQFSNPPAFKYDTDSSIEAMKSRKRRKIIEEED
ncbi:hypothetical protein EYC80_008651 [Monilinia laxa]|uniref:Uncharacterized protein n=1 Tax=Monilinia laxa TaxID=61186 RepID=A0A5N6K1E2_MONLA|nr:hypothetical protein EYC80_008651 [Monilinia laxa]